MGGCLLVGREKFIPVADPDRDREPDPGGVDGGSAGGWRGSSGG